MKTVPIKFGTDIVKLKLPKETEVFSMPKPKPLANPKSAIEEILLNSIGTPGLPDIAAEKLKNKPDSKAVIVISDNTRPVPYQGEEGILWPIIEKLIKQGFTHEKITILVANGTHRLLSEEELRKIVDERVFNANIAILNHDCKDQDNLVFLGKTSRGSKVYINRIYMEADLKILTGLVESHFMAGASGGRKSVCPGLIGEESTYIFHGAPVLSSPEARDLVLDGNPCHEEALEVAKKAGVDYIVNVTLDHQFNITGVFAGGLEEAHRQAVQRIREYVAIPMAQEYDIVVTHAGFVGINHYQAAKAGVVAIPALKTGGKLIMGASTTDVDPVGSPMYRTVLHLLKLVGAEKFNKLILSPAWVFIPEQWQVQMWARLFSKIPQKNFVYYSPQLTAEEYRFLPGIDGNRFLPESQRYNGRIDSISKVMEDAIGEGVSELKKKGQNEIRIAYLADGPYGIPVLSN